MPTVLPATHCRAGLPTKFRAKPRPTVPSRKVLVTGQAGIEETAKALNNADLDHCIAKPWTRDALHAVVRKSLTDYVIDEMDDLLPYVRLLDGPRLLEALKNRGGPE